jgi:hypothetical protein
MTNPPQGSDDRAAGPGGQQPDPDRYPTQPTPSYERPQSPPGYGRPAQPSWPPYTQPAPQPHGHQVPAPPPYVAPAHPYGQPPQYGAPHQGPPPYGPPQYGAPPYGPPGPGYGRPPAQKSHVGLIAAVTGGILVLIAGVVVLVMALQSTVLDRAAVERDVAAQFEDREGVAIELSCADEMEIESGAEYACTGTTADGEDVTLAIQIADPEDDADYYWTEP